MIKENSRPFFSILKKFDRFDFFTVIVFIVGFLLSVLDFKIMSMFEIILSNISRITFVISYVIMFVFLIFTTKVFVKNGSKLRVTKESKSFFQFLKLFLLGYYMGFIVNISNSFILVLFSKFIFN